jgi:hypothetical protein
MRRLTNLKHNATNNLHADRNKGTENLTAKQRRNLVAKNNPYPESALPVPLKHAAHGHSRATSVFTSVSQETGSILSYEDTRSTRGVRVLSTRSAAGTVATNPDTIHSDGGQSKAGTNFTNGGAMSSRTGGNSTFSTPQHSQESLTTTLTTLQSTAPSGMLVPPPNQAPGGTAYTGHAPPYIPPHLAPHQHQHTYSSATANNVLSDDASVLTLASSTKRRRRHSLDTNASVRALAPSSLFGASRESLPLSVLSANVETPSGVFHPTSTRAAVGGLASAERVSVYSASGIAPLLNSERNSYYAGKQVDGASVRSGLLGHGKSESISGSITGITASPLVSPKDGIHGRSSRRNSDWQDPDPLNWDEEVEEVTEQEDSDEQDVEPELQLEQEEKPQEYNQQPRVKDVKGKGRLIEPQD